MKFQLDSKIKLNSASKLKAIRHNKCQLAIDLMNFYNLLHYDLMTGIYWFIQFFYYAHLTLTVLTILRNSVRERI